LQWTASPRKLGGRLDPWRRHHFSSSRHSNNFGAMDVSDETFSRWLWFGNNLFASSFLAVILSSILLLYRSLNLIKLISDQCQRRKEFLKFASKWND
jgi:hypothetical protein